MEKTNNINGILIHYARLAAHPYGTKGQARDFEVEEHFLILLRKAFKEVFEACPFGVPEIITSAGIFVNKPGQHGHGTAFDLDAIFWKEESLITLNFIHQKKLYLGIESFLRKHFGIVLNYFYPNHKDHWHLDISVPVDFNRNSKSETLYLQMVLKYIYGEEIIVDGLWGPQTKSGTEVVFYKLGLSLPITTKSNYLKFLDLTGKIAFELVKGSTSPLDLLNNLMEQIESLPLHNKLEIRESLNSFMNHSETVDWLSQRTENPNKSLGKIIREMTT